MFRTERPWLEVYEKARVEPETRIFEGSLYEQFSRAVEEHQGKTALSFYGTTFEFGRLQALVEKMAGSASGYNVYPPEIEEVLFEHPDVAETVAIGVFDDYRGEAVKAFVVTRSGASTTEEVMVFCKERLAAYKTPKAVEFREELPKSAVGKLLRRVLVDEERAKTEAMPQG